MSRSTLKKSGMVSAGHVRKRPVCSKCGQPFPCLNHPPRRRLKPIIPPPPSKEPGK
jgi:transposase-like protein